MNPEAVFTSLNMMPYIAAGIVVIVCVSFGVLIYSTQRFFNRQQERATHSVTNPQFQPLRVFLQNQLLDTTKIRILALFYRGEFWHAITFANCFGLGVCLNV